MYPGARARQSHLDFPGRAFTQAGHPGNSVPHGFHRLRKQPDYSPARGSSALNNEAATVSSSQGFSIKSATPACIAGIASGTLQADDHDDRRLGSGPRVRQTRYRCDAKLRHAVSVPDAPTASKS